MDKEQEMARCDLVELDRLYERGDITWDEYLKEVKEIERTYKVSL